MRRIRKESAVPNVEIHGFFPVRQTPFGGMAPNQGKFLKAKRLIKEVLADLGLAKDAVITVFFSAVENCDDSDRPNEYIRVASTDPAEIPRIIEGLKQRDFDMDVETLVLTDFVPADKMRNPKPVISGDAEIHFDGRHFESRNRP